MILRSKCVKILVLRSNFFSLGVKISIFVVIFGQILVFKIKKGQNYWVLGQHLSDGAQSFSFFSILVQKFDYKVKMCQNFGFRVNIFQFGVKISIYVIIFGQNWSQFGFYVKIFQFAGKKFKFVYQIII